MGVGKKYDYPPLLATGRHNMTLQQVKAAFVDGAIKSPKRNHLFHLLEEFVQRLLVAGIPCTVWLDGSFLTEKAEPGDLDVTVILEQDVAFSLTADQNQLIEEISGADAGDEIDSFAFVRLGRDHPDYRDELLDPAYSWGEQYGLESSDEWLKGFVIIKLRETNVGLRICS